MADIGIRELKTHASEIVRKVKEEGRRYVVTRHGRPVAVIVPIEEAQAEAELQARNAAWDELVRIGDQVGKGWKSAQTSVEILSDMRR
jgi:prevent-host-death family protein